MHIRNIYEEGELTSEATVKKFLTVRKEGNREVRRDLEYHNLDMIISVGYRVKSNIATRFRIRATQRLRPQSGEQSRGTKAIAKEGRAEVMISHFKLLRVFGI